MTEALTADEIRALLDDSPPEEEPAEPRAAGGVPLLFVARRRTEAGLLRQRLAALGAHVSTARNPFQALDEIRLRPPRAIVSELDLWANEGELLFRRLAAANSSAPVLFVATSSPSPDTLVERLTRAGAWGVVFEPISPHDAETAALRLLEEARAAAEENDAADSGQATAASPPSPPVAPPPLAEPAPPRRDAAPGLQAELAALRLHLAVCRARSIDSAAGRALAISRQVRDLGVATGVAVVYSDGGRSRALIDACDKIELERLSRLLAGGGEGLVLGDAGTGCLALSGAAPGIERALAALGSDIAVAVQAALAAR